MASRQALHSILDDVPEHLLPIAEAGLLRLGRLGYDPFWAALAAADEDDEPLTAAEIAAIEAGWASIHAGSGLPDEELDKLLV